MRGCRLVVTALVAAAAGLVGVPVAEAATDSTDDLADRYGLVRQGDLPDGYELDSVRRETSVIPAFFEVAGDCDRFNSAPKLWGTEAATSAATFESVTTGGSRGGQGGETVFVFDDDDDAKKYYDRFAPEFDALVECGTMTDAVGNIGTYADLSVGKVGDQRTAFAFDPRADRYTRVALVRNDERVVYVQLYDDDATDAEFAALVKRAEKRSR